MLVYLPIGILILVPVSMLVLNRLRPGFTYHWLLAASSASIAWAIILAIGFQLPRSITITTWMPIGRFLTSPGLLIDRFSWPFGIALASLLLATMLTEAVRGGNTAWYIWASNLLLIALGLTGVFAADSITLLLAWSVIDMTELGLLLVLVKQPELRRGAILIYSIRTTGSFLLIGASLLSKSGIGFPDLANSPTGAGVLVFLAALLRLGVLPVNPPVLADQSRRQSLGTITRLVAFATALILVVRTGNLIGSVLDQPLTQFGLMAFLGLLTIYAGASWILSVDGLDGRPAWILGMALLSIVSALRGQPDASLAWAIAGILSGGLIFLFSVRDKISKWVALSGIIGISALPFTPAWAGTALFFQPFEPILLLFAIALVFFLAGYYHHAFLPLGVPREEDQWINPIYLIGLVILPLTHLGLGLYIYINSNGLPTVSWVVGPVLIITTIGYLVWEARGGRFPIFIINVLDVIFSFRWLSNLLILGYQTIGRFIYYLTRVIEGDGGVLWVLLWVVLLVAFLAISAIGSL